MSEYGGVLKHPPLAAVVTDSYATFALLALLPYNSSLKTPNDHATNTILVKGQHQLNLP